MGGVRESESAELRTNWGNIKIPPSPVKLLLLKLFPLRDTNTPDNESPPTDTTYHM